MRYLSACYIFLLALSLAVMSLDAHQAIGAEAGGGENAGAFTSRDGAELYAQSCQGCHMPQGEGAVGAGMYPALANNPLLSSPGGPTYVVLHGLRGMPSFDSSFDDEQVAAIINHVITNFGNKAKERITPQEVKAQRPVPPVIYP